VTAVAVRESATFPTSVGPRQPNRESDACRTCATSRL